MDNRQISDAESFTDAALTAPPLMLAVVGVWVAYGLWKHNCPVLVPVAMSADNSRKNT
jgi:hypothetical protein